MTGFYLKMGPKFFIFFASKLHLIQALYSTYVRQVYQVHLPKRTTNELEGIHMNGTLVHRQGSVKNILI